MELLLDPGIVVSIIAGSVAIVTAAFVFLTARTQGLIKRLESAEHRVAVLEDRDRRAWAYIAKLRDHIYKGLPPPPPSPDDLDELF